MADVPRAAELIQKDIDKVMKELERVYTTKDLWNDFWGEWWQDLNDLLREFEMELKEMPDQMFMSSEERAEMLQQIPLRKRRASAPAIMTPPTSPSATDPAAEAEKTK